MHVVRILQVMAVVTALVLMPELVQAQPRPGAGPNDYAKFAGKAKIIRVEKTAAANANKGKAAEGYEVVYTFKPDGEVPEPGKAYLEKFPEHRFTLINGMHVGPKFLKKYGLEKDKELKAEIWVKVHGATTPVLMKLDGVPNNDYFEAVGE